MPFTLAHPAIVLPLSRWFPRAVCGTGVVIGSMTPDLAPALFLPGGREFSHSLPGVVVVDVPLAVLLAFGLQRYARLPLARHAPPAIGLLLAGWAAEVWAVGGWARLLCSCAIGSLSHLVWDGFTHATGPFVAIWPALRAGVEIAGRELPVYRFLQHTSSVVGTAIVAMALARSRWPTPPTGWKPAPARDRAIYWTLVSGPMVALALARLLVALDRSPIVQASEAVRGLVGGGVVGLALATIWARHR